MKIIYFSHTCFSDCDFPLIQELQSRGHDVRYYIPVASYNLKSSLLDLKSIYPQTGIYPASVYEGFNIYKDVLDLTKCYVVNQVHKQKYHPLNIILMLRLVISFIMQKPDVIHLTYQPSFVLKLLYFVKHKLVLTVHDPFLHSSSYNEKEEQDRVLAFKKIPKLVLLNQHQVFDFCSTYKIPRENIFVNKLGIYDTITKVKPEISSVKTPYILFFGGISKYKGVDFLLEAMKIVNKTIPTLKLVVAGGGKYWFDTSQYENCDFIEFRHRYVGVPELAGLLSSSLFSVCPYRDATQSGVVQTSLSMGIPMIVTNVGALPEIVVNGKFGLVVAACDIEKLADSIIFLYNNPKLLEDMRKNIAKQWVPEMSWSPIVDCYLQCYETII